MATGQFSGKAPSGSGKDPRASVAVKPTQPARSGPPPEPGSGLNKVILIGGILLVLIVVANLTFAYVNGQKEAAERVTIEKTVEVDEAVKNDLTALSQQVKHLEELVHLQEARIQQLQSDVISFGNTVNDVNQKLLASGRN